MGELHGLTRRDVVKLLALAGASGAVPLSAVAATSTASPSPSPTLPFDEEAIACAERIFGTPFTADERKQMLGAVGEALDGFRKLRAIPLANGVSPAFVFDPMVSGGVIPESPAAIGGAKAVVHGDPLQWASVEELGILLRTKKTTSVELTKLALERLKQHDGKLLCVTSLLEERALATAARADEELASGKDRGHLHGIPYGAKDLLAARGAKTTWGAEPFRDQVIDEDATVIARLEEAGAVLVAKTTLGALAYGDVWYSGMTRNPWNLEEGSSGSSAGSSSAVAAGLLPFGVGSETLGSIVSPCTRCGATGLRPTFGRVPRTGAMALSWTMDKLGPIARSAADASLVLAAIAGTDGRDLSARAPRYVHPATRSLEGIRIGFVEGDFVADAPGAANDMAVIEDLKKLGAKLIPITLPDEQPVGEILVMLLVEAATAFDEMTRTNRDDMLTRQTADAWPNLFRAAQLVPAVEYVRAARFRTILMEKMAERFRDVDCYVAPSFSSSLSITNLTGHPAIVMPNGFNAKGSPTSITITGALYREDFIVRVGAAWQAVTDHHRKRPPAFV